MKDSIFLTPINELEIKKHINLIKPHSSFFEYGLNNNILKKTSNTISFTLMLIFNLALSSSVYNLFRKFVVTPIFKNGNKLDCSNYRPISLSLSLSKLLEKCIKSRVMTFLDKNKFYDNNQYGFVNGRSTSNAYFLVNHYIRDNLDKKQQVIGVFLDVKNAFDSINHELLLKKLENAGIWGSSLTLLSSYLSNRTSS